MINRMLILLMLVPTMTRTLPMTTGVPDEDEVESDDENPVNYPKSEMAQGDRGTV